MQTESSPSIFLRDDFASTSLAETCFTAPWLFQKPTILPQYRLPLTAPSCERFLYSDLSGTKERLSLVFFLVKSNCLSSVSLQGILPRCGELMILCRPYQPQAWETIETKLIQPLEACLPSWLALPEEKVGSVERLQLQVVQDLLDRIREAREAQAS